MSDTSIMLREAISEQARQAAWAWANAPVGTPEPVNPYPMGSDAHASWKAALQRWLVLFSAGDGGEASA